MEWPEEVLASGADGGVGCQMGFSDQRPTIDNRELMIGEVDLARSNVVAHDQGQSLVVETLAEGALEVGILFDDHRRRWIAHGAAVGLRVRGGRRRSDAPDWGVVLEDE